MSWHKFTSIIFYEYISVLGSYSLSLLSLLLDARCSHLIIFPLSQISFRLSLFHSACWSVATVCRSTLLFKWMVIIFHVLSAFSCDVIQVDAIKMIIFYDYYFTCYWRNDHSFITRPSPSSALPHARRSHFLIHLFDLNSKNEWINIGYWKHIFRLNKSE